MVCPKCGEDNPGSARKCRRCNYKFYFGHAYNDPQFLELPKPGKKYRLIFYLFLALFALILGLQIWFAFVSSHAN